jgi:hypothetical protein
LKKYEYTILDCTVSGDDEEVIDMLNRYGALGWALVFFNTDIQHAVLMREISE